jgi:hypothetical protein
MAQSKARRITAWVLSTLITLLFIMSAVFKFIRPPEVMEAVQKWNLTDELTMIGIGELVSALLFFIPKTHSLGVLLLSAYMGGAIVTHMQNDEPYIVQAITLLVIWIIAYLRDPAVLNSFRKKDA